MSAVSGSISVAKPNLAHGLEKRQRKIPSDANAQMLSGSAFRKGMRKKPGKLAVIRDLTVTDWRIMT
jgi:hypothetical protein